MGLIESLVGAVRVHASKDEQAVFVGGLSQFAVEVPVPQSLGSMVQWKLAGVVGDNTARIENDPLHPRFSPVAPPPRDVVARGIDLGDVGLPPAQSSTIPGDRIGPLALFIPISRCWRTPTDHGEY